MPQPMKWTGVSLASALVIMAATTGIRRLSSRKVSPESVAREAPRGVGTVLSPLEEVAEQPGPASAKAASRREAEPFPFREVPSVSEARSERKILAYQNGAHTAATERKEDTGPSPPSFAGKVRGKDYLNLVNEVHALGADLSTAQVQGLYEHLNREFERQDDLTLLEFNAIKNDILDKLIAQESIPEGLGQFIVTMYRDRGHDDLWRDYCIQHFALYHNARWPSGSAPEENAEARAMQSAFREALNETEGTIAGTALIGLETVSRKDKSYDRDKIGQAAISLAVDDTCHIRTRITAMQICGVMGRKEILPTARKVAREADSIPLRMSAIATIGDVGDSQDTELLKQILSSSGNTYVRKSAQSAMNRLEME